MKRPLYFLIPLLILGIISLTYTGGLREKQNDILPEIEAIITLEPLDQSRLNNNLFIALKGLSYPHDNYAKISETIFIDNYRYILKQYQNNEVIDSTQLDRLENYLEKGESLLIFNDQIDADEMITPSDYFPCEQTESSENCIDAVIQSEATIKHLLKINQILVARYHDFLTEYDHYATLFYPYAYVDWRRHDEWRWIATIQKLSHLQLAAAILAFNQGDREKGEAILMGEYRQLSLFLDQDKTALMPIEVNFLMRRFAIFHRVLNDLLDSGLVDQSLDSPFFEKLFTPTSEHVTSMMNRAIHYELEYYLFPRNFPFLLESQQALIEPKSLQLSYPQRALAFEWLDALYGSLLGLEFRNKVISNEIKMTVKFEADDFEALKTALMDQYGVMTFREDYFKMLGITPQDLLKFFGLDIDTKLANHQYLITREYLKLLNRDPYDSAVSHFEMVNYLSEKGVPSTVYVDSIKQLDNQLNYRNLLILKYQIKRDQIADANISQFLESMGDLAINRITKKPFKWDAEKRTLSTPIIEKQTINAPTSDHDVMALDQDDSKAEQFELSI